MNISLLSVSLLLAAAVTASAQPSGRKHPPSVRWAPRLGAFSAPLTIPVTVSGQQYLWQGTVTFTPQGSESVRSLSGTGTFKPLIQPPPPPPPPSVLTLLALQLSLSSLTSGQATTGKVTLSAAASAPTTVALSSSRPEVTVPPTVVVDAGNTWAPFPVATGAVAAGQTITATITAKLGSQSLTATMRVTAPPLPPPPPPPPPGGDPLIQRIRKPDGTPVIFPLVIGTVLKVEGTSFGSVTGKLYVNGYPMPVSGWSDTAVSFTVAADATRQYPGWVTVERPDGRLYSGNFKRDGSGPVPEPPLFDAFYDAAGAKVTQAVEGTLLTLKGSHFGTRGMVIYSGWAVAEIVTWSDTQITFKAPFAWWDKRVSSVEVFSGSDPSPSLSGRKGLWPSFTILPAGPGMARPPDRPAPRD